jgi:hypothetical protein
MLSHSIWSVGIVLELLLLLRGYQQNLFRRYPIFFAYISFILVSDIVMVLIGFPQRVYLYLYWMVEFISLVFGCLIVFEFYRVALHSYRGTARMARALLAVLFLLAMIKTVVSTLNVPRWWFDAKPAQVEGILRVCELLAILSLVVLLLFYSIPVGKNLRGILLGYGVFVSWSVVCLALVSTGVAKFDSLWSLTFPFSYLIGLVVWTAHLWSYQPNPVPDPAIPLEQEYQRVAAATQRRLHDARGYLAKAVGS